MSSAPREERRDRTSWGSRGSEPTVGLSVESGPGPRASFTQLPRKVQYEGVSTVCGLNSTSCARRALADRGASTAARVRPVTRTRAPQAARRGGR